MIDEFIGKTLAGKYRIEEQLRSGVLGNIYRGTHLLMEKSVSVKILDPALAVDENTVRQFSAEARISSRLSHPNILNVTDFGREESGTVFIVTEDASGDILADLVRSEGAFSIERATTIAVQAAAALAAAHSTGMVHRVLTSQKILLTKMEDGSELVKLLDLGLSTVEGQRNADEGSAVEKLAYLSPEQFVVEAEADWRSDIYSLGIIFYEMLAGEVPFMADSRTALMRKHAEVPPPPLSAFRDDIPQEVESAVIRALAKNPDLRYQSVTAFAEDLEEASRNALSDDSIEASEINTAAANTASQNNVWKTAFLALAGIMVLAFGLIYWTNVKRTNPQTVLTDENGLPVQPLNPATGLHEQNIPGFVDYPTNSMNPDDLIVRPGIEGGDGYDAWRNGGRPPAGAPPPIGSGDEYVTFPPTPVKRLPPGSQRYIDDDGNEIILVPQNTPAKDLNTKDTAKPEKSPGATKSPSPLKDGGKGDANTTKNPTSPSKKDAKKPGTKKTIEKPKKNNPSTKKRIKSGKEQDT